MSAGGGSSENNGGVGGFRLYAGVAALGEHVDATAFTAGTGGMDIKGLFGIGVRGYALTGGLRPYALANVAVGIYAPNTSRPVRVKELGGGVALVHKVGRRAGFGLHAELAKSWISIGSDPIFPQIMGTADEAIELRIGFVGYMRPDKKR
jgi:hypothetical protein